ncbi:hypothetical protein [Paraglaciecola chathamensis]|uniref:hypothetical protein n=1 Tax=Paraglaciecola chathamensis TaxID=368405 RepID=UPI0026FA3B19|nr:hypothetical protein [Paraglaciecola chathamensis]MDO6557616.1 hypothetical protein [Paraglaciecola chathamensis]
MELLLLPLVETLIIQMELEQLHFWSLNANANTTQVLFTSELNLSMYVSNYKFWVMVLKKFLFFGCDNTLFINRRFRFIQNHYLTCITIKKKNENWEVDIVVEASFSAKSDRFISKLYKVNYIK